jgi:putative nucleotidyltransferase-like protein
VYTCENEPGAFFLTERFPSGTEFLKKEWPVLCACVAPSADKEHIRELLGAPFDWDVLLELAEEHSVQGILAKRMQQLEFAGVPAAAREKLQARMRAQHLFTLSLTAELFRVLDDFSEAGLEAMVIKGPVTALVAHGDPALRGFGDVDLLIRQKDIANASRRMQAQGFEADVSDRAIQAGKVPGEYVFRRPGTNRMVEIHTQQTFRYYPNGMPIDELFQRKRLIQLEGREVSALSLTDEVIFHCVHGAKDFWEKLMWICDVASLAKNHPGIDWQSTWRAAADCGAARMVSVGLLLGADVLGMPLPTAIAERIERDHASKRLCAEIQTWLPFGGGAPPSLQGRALYRVSMAGGGISGMKYLARLSLLPTEEDWRAEQHQSRSWFWDAVRRPFRLMRKYGSED